MTEQTILFSSDVTPAAANNFASVLTTLAQAGATKLVLGVNSGGGNVVAGIFLHNLLVSMPFEIVTHNVGNVDSIANVIFMAGSTRLSCAPSTFMFHGVGFDPGSERLEEKNLREKLDTISADHARISHIISSRSKLSDADCRRLLAEQSTRGAQWALDSGLITGIADFAYPSNGQFYSFFG